MLKVSIITPTYNSEATLQDTLETVAKQSYPNIEHIIVDGLSTDSTLQIASAYMPHVRIISEKDLGLYDAMNKGIRMASGDLIGILNSDDFFVGPEIVSQVVEKMELDGSDALYADLVFVDRLNTNKILRSWRAGNFHIRKFLFGWMPPHPTFFVRKRIYDQYGMFNTNLTFSADYDLMLRLLYKHHIKVSYLPKVIIKMRFGGVSNASVFNRLKANKEDREAWRLNGLKPYFFTVALKPTRKLIQYFSFRI